MQNNMDEKSVSIEEKEQAFSQINKKSFFVVVSLLLGIIFLCFFLTYIIPQGYYERDENGMIVAGTFVLGKAKGIAP